MGFTPFLIKAPILAMMIAGGAPSGLSGLPGAPGTPAAGASGVTIASGALHVKANGHSWTLSMIAAQGGTNGIILADLHHSSAAGAEEHAWEVLSRSAVVTKTRGGWKIDPKASAVAPLLSVNLKFTITSHSRVKCSRGSATLYRGRLTGRLILATQIRRLGKVGSRSVSFSKPNTAVVDKGCVGPRPPCPSPGYSWLGVSVLKSGAATEVLGSRSHGVNVVALARLKLLPKPSHAVRIDAAIATGGTLAVSGGTLTATARSGSLLSGSATLTASGPPTVSKAACWRNGHKHTATDTSFTNAALSTSLVAHTLATGTIRAGKTGSGTFDKITIS